MIFNPGWSELQFELCKQFYERSGEHISHFRQTVDEDSNLPSLSLWLVNAFLCVHKVFKPCLSVRQLVESDNEALLEMD